VQTIVAGTVGNLYGSPKKNGPSKLKHELNTMATRSTSACPALEIRSRSYMSTMRRVSRRVYCTDCPAATAGCTSHLFFSVLARLMAGYRGQRRRMKYNGECLLNPVELEINFSASTSFVSGARRPTTDCNSSSTTSHLYP